MKLLCVSNAPFPMRMCEGMPGLSLLKFNVSFTTSARYIPVGVLERLPQRINERPPSYVGRDDLETLMSSNNCKDWIKIRWVSERVWSNVTLRVPCIIYNYVLLGMWSVTWLQRGVANVMWHQRGVVRCHVTLKGCGQMPCDFKGVWPMS